MNRNKVQGIFSVLWILFICLYAISVLVGLVTGNEIFFQIEVVVLFYISALLIIALICTIPSSAKKWKKKRKHVIRQRDTGLLQCPNCEKVYNREELDLSPTATPLCPDCEETFVPYHLKREE